MAYVLNSVRRETINPSAMDGKLRRFDQEAKAHDLSERFIPASDSNVRFKLLAAFIRALLTRTLFKRAFQARVMCKCKFVALGGEGVEWIGAREYLSDQPPS